VPFLAARSYTVVKCSGCGLLFVNPQPGDAELAELYASHDQGDQWRIHEEHFNRAIRQEIVRLRQSGSLLDVGSGSGNFLGEMREAGFSVFGVERSESGWRYATESHGLDVFHGPLEHFLQFDARRSFDVITLLNVLEHLRDPQGLLRALGRIASPGALLVLVVPDVRLHAILAKIRQLARSKDPFWMDSEHQPIVAIDPPYHLTCFEPRTLRLLLERCGYRTVKITNAPVISNPQLWKRLSKLAVASFGRCMQVASLGRTVIGYSTLVIAQNQYAETKTPT
jgi:SAM-dependent methyltransferase